MDSYLFGKRINEERKKLGFSQAEIARLCGVSREMWGKYERNKAVMGVETLSNFVRLGADALYILTSKHKETFLSRDEIILLDNYRHSSPENRNIIKMVSSALFQYDDQDNIVQSNLPETLE